MNFVSPALEYHYCIYNNNNYYKKIIDNIIYYAF
jgi:hypothetical protein